MSIYVDIRALLNANFIRSMNATSIDASEVASAIDCPKDIFMLINKIQLYMEDNFLGFEGEFKPKQLIDFCNGDSKLNIEVFLNKKSNSIVNIRINNLLFKLGIKYHEYH